ncbi:hypothetical protein [Hyalangium sp.]|uniref:hypothetical protein n=1 Tax=Hyalangium sp. TaxID=2028555 RepID=UPI002D3633A1|nr:hypothetical protein [Hyalangium sp.]HYH98365.1 hypothetical protein [Hyalangium sp.]
MRRRHAAHHTAVCGSSALRCFALTMAYAPQHEGYTLALDERGTLWEWGSIRGHDFALAPLGETVSPTPARVSGMPKRVSVSMSTATFTFHSLALQEDGKVLAWATTPTASSEKYRRDGGPVEGGKQVQRGGGELRTGAAGAVHRAGGEAAQPPGCTRLPRPRSHQVRGRSLGLLNVGIEKASWGGV